MNDLPVIFLAFANDHQSYLYKLTEEQDAIRSALKKAESQGLCKVIYETDTDLNKIWQTFDEYKERISIFHYGGHATDYAIMLKQASGEHQIAHAEGLVSFLGQQKGLKLVFLNGCSSKRQAEEIRDKGVPAVIGTAWPVDDAMATQLSGKFYKSLAEGRSLEQSWLGAKDFVLAHKGTSGYTRDFVGKFDQGTQKVGGTGGTSDFPWDLYVKPGAEQVKSWNLAREARNPLFNLPLPDSYFLRLRNSPFVGLHFFQEEDSALFFGRGAQIREIYNHLKGIHPIILLYGRSGVGKSSMLDAGLLPRIKDSYTITYARRIQEKGLLGTLELALDSLYAQEDDVYQGEPESVPESDSTHIEEARELLQNALAKVTDSGMRQQIEGVIKSLDAPVTDTRPRPMLQLTGILKKWQTIEEHYGKPLVIILDQVEEKFTRPIPEVSGEEDELFTFLTAIQPLFGGNETVIRGKLILSYRKEYHPEIKDTFQALSLPYAELFLKRLDKEGIVEAIKGVNQHSITRAKYRLQIEDNLPEIIADDLMEDNESPIAPVLQIILEKLWNTSYLNEQEPVSFSIQAYQELKKKGTTMDEFFQQQIEKLKELLPEAVASGLAMDILHAHTTNLGTAGSCRRENLFASYELHPNVIAELIRQLEDLSLLARIDDRFTGEAGKSQENYTTILAHDTLAPIVIRAFNLSDAPGQRAARILSNKLADVGFRLREEDAAKLVTLQEMQSSPGVQPDLQELKQEYTGPAHFRTMLRNFLPEDPQGRIEQEMLDNAHINLQPNGQTVFFEESDLAIVEQGSGMLGDSLPGMPKLPAAGEEMIAVSRQKRAERIQREKAIRRRQRIFTAAITVAMLVATGLGIWAVREQGVAKKNAIEAKENAKKAEDSLADFQKAQAAKVKQEVTNIWIRAKKLENKYPEEYQLLMKDVENILSAEENQQNPELKELLNKIQSGTYQP